MEIKKELTSYLKRAYKKLKAAYLYDKTCPQIRHDIVLFEKMLKQENKTIEQTLNEYADELLSSNNEWNDIENKILDTIDIIIFPKKIKDETKSKIVTNIRTQNNVFVSNTNMFIDLSIKGHILSTLWILLIGKDIDKLTYQNSYGNRINEHVLQDNHEGTPYLFKPYFEQYEYWRNKGLKKAKELLVEDKENVLVIMLDFRKYYYSVRLNDDIFKTYLGLSEFNNKSSDFNLVLNRLNVLVKSIIEVYSENFRLKDNKDTLSILPIGFLPSHIIANRYLLPFDMEIVNKINPAYYGRYIDDIIIVLKIETSSYVEKIVDLQLKNNEGDNQKTLDDILNHYFVKNVDNPSINTNIFIPPDICSDSSNNYVLRLFPDIMINKEKIHTLYFKKNSPSELLDSILIEIRNDKSMFNYLPEEDLFNELNKKRLFNLEHSDDLSKIRSIKDFNIDSYELSRLLGNQILSSKVSKDYLEKLTASRLNAILSENDIISNYKLWEQILSFMLVNENYLQYTEFIVKVLTAIEKVIMTTDEDSCNHKDLHIDTSDSEQILKKSLKDYLSTAIYRTLSLIWGKEYNQLLNNLKNHEYIKQTNLFDYVSIDDSIKRQYIDSMMLNGTLIPIQSDAININHKNFKSNDDTIKLYDVSTYPGNFFIRKNKEILQFSPIITSPFEIEYSKFIESIIDDKKKSLLTTIFDCKSLSKEYFKYFIGDECNESVDSLKPFFIYEHCRVDRDKQNYEIIVDTLDFSPLDNNNIIKIAIANVLVSDNDIENAIRKQIKHTYKKFYDTAKLINEAISENVNIIVFPECYLPHQYLPILQHVCRRNNIVIIAGLEHIRMNNQVYNVTATLLPFSYNGFKYCYPHFHLKVHYAPDELKQINGYGYTAMIGNKYTKIRWNNFNFTTYCCYEVTSIDDRAIFLGQIEGLFIVEHNQDTNYFSSIIDSLSRDLHCYCIQSNTSNYGDGRIVFPGKTEVKDLIKVKGSENSVILTASIDINKLKYFRSLGEVLQMDNKTFKITPPYFRDKSVKIGQMNNSKKPKN